MPCYKYVHIIAEFVHIMTCRCCCRAGIFLTKKDLQNLHKCAEMVRTSCSRPARANSLVVLRSSAAFVGARMVTGSSRGSCALTKSTATLPDGCTPTDFLRCYTEKAPNSWHRRGTQKTGNTYNQPKRPGRHTSQTKHQALSKGQEGRRITPSNTAAVHASAHRQPTIITHTYVIHTYIHTPDRVMTRFSQPTQPAAKPRSNIQAG